MLESLDHNALDFLPKAGPLLPLLHRHPHGCAAVLWACCLVDASAPVVVSAVAIGGALCLWCPAQCSPPYVEAPRTFQWSPASVLDRLLAAESRDPKAVDAGHVEM